MNTIPRRIQINLLSKGELAIYNAVQEIEKMPPDIRLTDAVNLLAKAREKVADFIDNIPTTNKPEPSIQEEDKENIISIISSNLYNISNQSGQHLLTTDKCDEISEFIYNDLKEHFTQPKPLQEDCHCTPDQTTGHTAGICNVCGKDVEDAAIKHADSLHKKGSSELAGNGKLTENDCWENAYFNFKEGQNK